MPVFAISREEVSSLFSRRRRQGCRWNQGARQRVSDATVAAALGRHW